MSNTNYNFSLFKNVNPYKKNQYQSLFSNNIKDKTYWSSITWLFLHTFPLTFTDDFYNNNKKTILNLIYSICVNVPCPICSKHARMHLNKYNYFHENINKNKEDLILNVFHFHNIVNTSLSKPLFNKNLLNAYNNLDFIEIYNEWMTKYTINIINLKLYNQKINVNNIRNTIKQFINKNLKYLIINRNKNKTLSITNNY
jgi:hypothetical protein